MGNSNIPVIKFLFRSSWHALAEAIHLQPSLDVKVCSLANDVSNHLINAPAVLIMASIREKNDLIQLATLMKISRSWSKELSCKIVVINFTNDQQFEKAITKLGVQDVIDAGINTKALKFKMDFWMKSLQAQVRGSVIASQAPKNLKNNEINKLSETKTANTVPNWSSSLATDNDIWIVKNEGDCKKILSKWLVKLKGPSPYVGQWTEVGPDTWRFDLKDLERKEFTPGKGHWFYKGGNKPDFYWSENTWLFAGENFDLFYKDADQHHSRISCRNRIFTICENSKFAENKTKLIAESCDKDLVYRKEADVLANLEGQVKGGADHLKNLEGKTKTDRLKDGPLSGSTKGTDSLGNGLLSQKTETAHEVTHWQGKNSYQQTDVSDFAGPSGQKIAKGKTLELEDGNHEHQKYYKNHNPSEEFKAKQGDLKSPSGKVDAIDGYMGGKQKTGADRSNNLSGTSSAERPDAKTKNQDTSSGKVDHLAGHLSGKQKTGADRSNNLSGTSSAERPEAKTKDQDSSGGKVDHLAGHLSGKQKTEAGRSNDLAGKTSAERPEAKTKDQDSSGGMVDHLAGHLSGKQKTGADRSNNLSGTSSPEKSEAKTKDQDSSGGKVDHLAGHLSGKQKTGADRSNNLSGTSSAERPEAKTKDQDSSGGKVDHLAGHLSGKQKSGSDRSNDLSGRISPERTEANKAKDEDSPSGKVDHFAGHLNGKQKSGADRSNNLAGKTSAESAESNLEPRELKSSLASDEKKKQEKFSFEYNKKGEKKKDVPKGDASRAEESSLPSETSPEIESKEFPKEKNSESKQAERGAKTLSSEDDQQWAGLVGDSLTTPPARQQRPDQEPAGVLSLEKARQDRIKKILLSDPETSELDELDELAASAKVTAYLKQGRLNLLCELDDFFDETLIFISPKSLKTESEVNLVLHFDYFNKIETLDMVGTITVQEDSDNGQSYVTVKLKNKNVEKFESFMKLYKTRQANVNSFLKSVKGF
ncbi:MAG TPA: hypothetical protein VNJ01_03785 [Bacteriovoracaceae bacterium]|nr:hypothetical protein [Bacteriovoracaceae bacterium]